MKKQIKLTVIAIAVALSALMSACGDSSKVVQSCGDITTCAIDAPREFQAQYGQDLQQANDALLDVLK